jgi:hypothetical protein
VPDHKGTRVKDTKEQRRDQEIHGTSYKSPVRPTSRDVSLRGSVLSDPLAELFTNFPLSAVSSTKLSAYK